MNFRFLCKFDLQKGFWYTMALVLVRIEPKRVQLFNTLVCMQTSS